MSLITDADNKFYNLTRLISFAMLIIAPIVYLIIASINTKDYFQAQGNAELIMYLLIPIAAFEPFVWLVIKKVQVRMIKKTAKELPVSKTYLTLMNIKLSFIAAIYVYGLVAFYLTNDIMNMAWFYLIGAVWSVIYWPRKSHFERVMNDGLEAI